MSTIVTRAGKGSALTWTEGDANITNLNNDKMEAVIDDTNPKLGGNLDVDGKTILGGSYGGNQVILPVGGGTTIKSLYEGGVNFLASNDGGTTSKSWKLNIDGTTDFPAFKFPATDGTANYVLKTNGAGVLSWAALPSAGMTGFTAAGDSGTSQTVGDGNTLTIAGGVGLSSVASATDTITINLDNTAVTAASYTYASITVDAQGRITAASNGTTPLTSGGALGTPSSGNLSNCTADGTNTVGFRVIPSAGAEKSGSYTLTTNDRGEFVQVASGGSITVPNSTFAAGDVVVIYNNHTATITITLSTTNAYIAGTNTNKTSVSLATRGVCNILFVSATMAILTGNVS